MIFKIFTKHYFPERFFYYFCALFFAGKRMIYKQLGLQTMITNNLVYEKPGIVITVIEVENALCISTEDFNRQQNYETEWN